MATQQAPGVLKRTSAYFIDPRAIVRKPGFNPRFDFGEIEVLATSIRANGVLNAIRVKRIDPTPEGHLFELIDGDRRLTAIESILEKDSEAFKEGVPAIIVDRAQDDITSLIQMFEANSGKVFVPLEEASAYKRMRDAGMTLVQIQDAVGRKVPHIADMLTLLNADDSVKDAVTDGTIGKQMAKSIAKAAKGDKTKQKELVEKAKAAKGDKKGKRQVVKEVQKARVAKAASKGKSLKIQALTNDEISEIGTALNKLLNDLLELGTSAPASDLAAWVKGDNELLTAYAYGALSAMRVAAGQPNDLITTVEGK